MSTSQEYARKIDWTPEWSTGAPCPQVFSNGHETYLTYYTIYENDPSLVLVTFFQSLSHRFGIVNDEAADGHPLNEKGLETYRAHIIENSTWIEEHRQIHKVHHRYSDKHWIGYKHYLLFFHDEIFEVIFSGDYKIETFNSTMKELALEVAGRLNH
ncbi:MAG TPA: hypothetical protein VIZ28_06625 [Chitinophagaceae bacterium]